MDIPKLPQELKKYVTEDKLIKNISNYPEMCMEITNEKEEKLAKIREVLTNIPLIHATHNENISNGSVDILPLDEIEGKIKNNSSESDKSLGFTNCTFFSWGFTEKKYGPYATKFSQELLNKESTFITPYDIGEIVMADDCSFDNYSEEKKEKIEKYYFNHIVSGKVWKEIIARRILNIIESGEKFYPLSNITSLGEIKHFGKVEKSYFLGKFKTSDMKEHYRFLYENGFSYKNMEDEYILFQKYGIKYGINPTYEE